ncbi:FeoC-like transcriptional regulator [Nocardia sp. NBC_00511]|uniref:FeoC-like transcriptional regulator n=1 Tax=Nocardia sp. NBC_00511 TaxID=2903591 RepID=UPI0030E46644
MTAALSPLRQVLAEITGARGELNLDQIARRVGVSRDEIRSMVDYWQRKGRLSVERLGSGCPAAGCGSCVTRACPTRAPEGPVLLAITPRLPLRAGQ